VRRRAQLERLAAGDKLVRVGGRTCASAAASRDTADQYVLAVVEVGSVDAHAASAPPRLREASKTVTRRLLSERDRSSESGPAGADDRGAAQAVTQSATRSRACGWG